MLALARATAAALAGKGRAAAVAPALRLRSGVRDSASLTAAQRIENLRGRVWVDQHGMPPADATTILLDDVVTTGATAAACVAALRAAGREVSAVVTLTAV